MTESPPSNPPSLDDLLRRSRTQFDAIVSSQFNADALSVPLALEPPAEPDETPPVADAPRIAESTPPSGQVPKAETPISPAPERALDTVTVDLIAGALNNTVEEMQAVRRRAALASGRPAARGALPAITDAEGRMIAGGRAGFSVAPLLHGGARELRPGEAILCSDPWGAEPAGPVSEWFVIVPAFHDGALAGFCILAAEMEDAGGWTAGGMTAAAPSSFAEGIRIPAMKIPTDGTQEVASLDILLANTREPDANYAGLRALLLGGAAGARRVAGLCGRFGRNRYTAACHALFARADTALRAAIARYLPREPQSFEDFIDDDGCGNGPLKLKLSVWREGEDAWFDWTGTAPQSPGSVNLRLHDDAFRLYAAAHLAALWQWELPLNDGLRRRIHVTLPHGSLLQPAFPAALGCGAPVLARMFDTLAGALAKCAPEQAAAVGHGALPYFRFASTDAGGLPFRLTDFVPGGLPAGPHADGADGHSLWPGGENTPVEKAETRAPIRIEACRLLPDSGGAGLHRGGNGVEKIWRVLAAGSVSLHDDRSLNPPWGVRGGAPGARSEKWLVRENGDREPLPANSDNIRTRAGDSIVFRTAGGGGWGNPLDRDAARVARDVAHGLVSADAAREHYGVVLAAGGEAHDAYATEDLRIRMKHEQRPPPLFRFGSNGNAAVDEPPGNR